MKLARELLLCVLSASAWAAPAEAQIVVDRSLALAPAEVELLDATSATHLENATRFLAEKQWDEAVDAIRRAMEGDGGRFVQVADEGDALPDGFERLVPVREFCQWRLAALAREAPEALAHYRSLADPLAEQWLRLTSENRDERLLKRIVSDAFATSAADEALLRLGDLALARGEFAVARGYFARIGPQLAPPADGDALPPENLYPDTTLAPETVRARLVLVSILAGERQRAEQELEQFRAQHAEAQGELAGRSGNLAELLAALLAQSQDWPPAPLREDWLTFAGNPARNAAAGGPIEPAGQPRWTFDLPRLEAERDVIGAGRLRVGDDARGLLSYFPLIVGDTALVRVDARGLSSIVALDLASGDVRWQVDAPRDPERTGADPDAGSEAQFEVSDAHAGLLRHVGVARHTLTVHGGKLFARMGSPVTAPPATRLETILSKSQGFLMGYDLASEGKPLDGFPIRPESGEWSFEGTPLCNGANLYVAMRRIEQGRCQMHVACFALATSGAAIDDADDNSRPTGRMLWRTKICSAGTLGMGDLSELSHVLLSMDGGTLLVNTQLGAVAAIDAATGGAAWVCKYPRATFKSGDPDRHDDHFFRDLTPCLVAGDLVIVAPADSDRLFALNRSTGSLAWATEPGIAADAIHLLGTSGNWLIASGDRLYWIDLASGQVAARFPNTPSGGPMHAAANPRGLGRGLIADDHIYWPTREAIYVFRGSPRKSAGGSFAPDGTGEIPLVPRGATGGNLILGRGTLLIATGDKLHAFDCRQAAAGGE